MNRMALAVLSSLTLLTSAACTSSASAAQSTSSEPVAGKVTAPVKVEAQLKEDQAHITVRFDAPATDVKINVYGVDGLVVKNAATPVEGASFTQSAVQELDVTFTPGPGRSHLVVAVSGSFRGAERSSVSSFSIGTPSAAQQQSQGNVVTGDDGQRVKIMPAGDNTK